MLLFFFTTFALYYLISTTVNQRNNPNERHQNQILQTTRKMNIGDRVRLLHSKEEGIVTKFLKNDVIEVEIEDGLKLPILRKELALVASVENQIFGNNKNAIEAQKTPQIRAERGIFMAFVPQNEKEVSLFVINNTDWLLPFSITTGKERQHRGLAGGTLIARSFQKVQDLVLKDFDEWGTFIFQTFYFTQGYFTEQNPFIKRLKLKADVFSKQKQTAPLLFKDAHLFQLDIEDAPAEKINPTKLREQMLEKPIETPPIGKQFERPIGTVDLHIEQITSNFLAMNNAEMLELQLKTFEQKLDNAIANGIDEITFIHGVGNGVLRNEIHRKLSKHQFVAYFQDAQKDKFGYGATKVKIK